MSFEQLFELGLIHWNVVIPISLIDDSEDSDA